MIKIPPRQLPRKVVGEIYRRIKYLMWKDRQKEKACRIVPAGAVEELRGANAELAITNDL